MWFCLLMLFNTSVDYTNGRLMGAYPARKKLFVTISIVCDLFSISRSVPLRVPFFVSPSHKHGINTAKKTKKTSLFRGFRVDFVSGMHYIIRIN